MTDEKTPEVETCEDCDGDGVVTYAAGGYANYSPWVQHRTRPCPTCNY